MEPNEKTLTIVYQFGKVASTSLVNTLRAQSHLDVHQSHFLGESALQRIIPIAVGKATNAYFHDHLRGQLLANVALTYRMNRVLGGQGAAKLKVISLSREPLDWLRSGILQDITGYRSELTEFANELGFAREDDHATLRAGLVAVLSRLTELIDSLGGADKTVAAFHELGGQQMLAPEHSAIAPIVRRLFFLALRPLTWFEEHFQPCFGISLPDFDAKDRFWVARQPRADFVILRYEDLSEALPRALKAIGIHVDGPLERDNVSRTKPFANDVAAAFASPEADALRMRLLSSDYAMYFGYADTAARPKTAAE